MDMLKLAKRFNKDEDGAVTVDWVVLTAAIVGLGIAVIASVREGVNTLGTTISESVASQTAGG